MEISCCGAQLEPSNLVHQITSSEPPASTHVVSVNDDPETSEVIMPRHEVTYGSDPRTQHVCPAVEIDLLG